MVGPIRGDSGIEFMRAALDVLAAQQQAIANNVANVDTPGYRRQSVPFQELLREQMQGDGRLAATDGRHLGSAARPGGHQLAAAQEVLASGKNDGNNVEIERELTEFTQNQVTYYAVTQAISGKLATLREIISRAV